MRKYPERAKGLGIGEIKAGHEHRLLFSKVYCWSHPQQKPSTTGAFHNRKGHMKRKFSCALKFYFVISNEQTGNMRLKFNIICRVVMLLQLVCSSYGSDVRVYTFIPVQEAFQVDYIADRKVLNSCVYIGVLVAQIRLNGEGIGSAILGNGEV